MSTPNDVATDLGVSQEDIQNILRSLYGLLPDDQIRWDLSPQHERIFRKYVTSKTAENGEWPFEVGDVFRRQALHDLFGGQRQVGISTPKDTSDIFIFTNPNGGRPTRL